MPSDLHEISAFKASDSCIATGNLIGNLSNKTEVSNSNFQLKKITQVLTVLHHLACISISNSTFWKITILKNNHMLYLQQNARGRHMARNKHPKKHPNPEVSTQGTGSSYNICAPVQNYMGIFGIQWRARSMACYADLWNQTQKSFRILKSGHANSHTFFFFFFVIYHVTKKPKQLCQVGSHACAGLCLLIWKMPLAWSRM